MLPTNTRTHANLAAARRRGCLRRSCRDALAAQRERLRRVEATLVYMAHYAEHAGHCDDGYGCNCGLDTIMADYDALKPFSTKAVETRAGDER